VANQLKMAKIQAILSLHAQGWTQVRIAETLQVDRETVRKYVRQQSCGPKPANAPTGSNDSKPPGFSGVSAPDPKPPNEPIGPPAEPSDCPGASAPTGLAFASGPASQCAPYRELIAAKLVENLSYQRIWQDLAEAGFTVHYDSLRRFCRRLMRRRALPVRRMECAPGDEAQVDFGSGAPIISSDGKRRRIQ
jgi:transposase